MGGTQTNRLIHHLSYSNGSSVNDNIPHECSSVHYATISDAIAAVKREGAGCSMAKTDIKSAFWIIPIHPSDFPLMGMKWDNLYYFDVSLAMGLSSSCAIFEAFSSSLEWLALHRLGASAVLHILDDFLFIASSESKCRTNLSNFFAYVCVPRGTYCAGKNIWPRYSASVCWNNAGIGSARSSFAGRQALKMPQFNIPNSRQVLREAAGSQSVNRNGWILPTFFKFH